jgi:predicted nucleic acid-binding protein
MIEWGESNQFQGVRFIPPLKGAGFLYPLTPRFINIFEKIIFDTNIFIYSALDHPKYGNPCTQLIHEVESGKIKGYVLNEKINTLAESLIISQRYSLLATDAYIVSFAKSYNISNIMTNDSDFENVEWLKVWKPYP